MQGSWGREKGNMAFRLALRLFAAAVFAIIFAESVCSADDDILREYNIINDNFRAMKMNADLSSDRSVCSSLRSAKGGATVRLGGELFTDYIGSIYDGKGIEGTDYDGKWYIHNSNLRFDFQFSDNLKAEIKIDLSDSPYRESQMVMEEAMIIWESVCGGPFGLFFGVGEVPYGQDRTLGIIQSYNHTEGYGSSEGPIILSAPYLANARGTSNVYHPGEVDRVVMAGISYTWNDIIKAEFAFFNPSGFNDNIGIYDSVTTPDDAGVFSFAARLWWNMPIDGLIAEISGIRKHVAKRGDKGLYGPDALRDEYAVSAGLDWNIDNNLEVFAEYQHGFNWGFIQNYHTDTVSLGMLYDLTERLSLGGMIEWLHISDRGDISDFNKFVLHTQYKFANGVYLIAEYGAELYNWDGALTNVIAVRSGVTF